MGAADEIRAGKLEKYRALDDAGVNTSVVKFSRRDHIEDAKPEIGRAGVITETLFTLTPKPQVQLKRREILNTAGITMVYDAEIKGAFPDELHGVELINGGETGETEIKLYNDPQEFIKDLQTATYILIDDIKYQFTAIGGAGGASVNVNATKSEWMLRLVRA